MGVRLAFVFDSLNDNRSTPPFLEPSISPKSAVDPVDVGVNDSTLRVDFASGLSLRGVSPGNQSRGTQLLDEEDRTDELFDNNTSGRAEVSWAERSD